MACRNQHRLEPGVQRREVYPFREDPAAPGRHFLSVSCGHCREPECLRVCQAGALAKTADGLVLPDLARCTGCRLCSLACPHGSPRFSVRTRKITKCTFCHDRLEQGLLPACVGACPAGALTVIDLDTFAGPCALATVPGFPGSEITTPSLRFTVPGAGGSEGRGGR